MSIVIENILGKIDRKIHMYLESAKSKPESDLKPGCRCKGKCKTCRKLTEQPAISISIGDDEVPYNIAPSERLNVRDTLRPMLINALRRIREKHDMQTLKYPTVHQIPEVDCE